MKFCIINVNKDRSLEELYDILKTITSVEVSTKYESGFDVYILNREISITETIPTHVKIIYCCTHNPFVDDIESFVYNKHQSMQWILTSKIVSEIWILDHYEKYKMYLETMYKLPITIVPFTYIQRNIAASATAIKNESIIDIVLYDTNESFNQSSFKLLYICQEFYKRFPSKLGTVYLFNVPDNETATKLIESTDLWKHKKLRKFVKIPETDMLSYFNNSPHKSVFISNTILPHITQFMYDIIINNLYLIHTQKDFPYGLYYDVNDVELCIDYINDTSRHKRIDMKNIENYYSHTIIPFYKTHMSTYVDDTTVINIHEQMCENKNDISKPLVITYDNNPNENTKFYINTLKKNKWEYVLIGKDEKWEGWVTRMRAYLSILKTLNPNKVVVLTDARDVICCRSANAFMDAFTYYESDLIACMELICDNNIDQPADYIGNQCHPIKNYWKHHNMQIPKRQYVNNGLVAGKVYKLIELLQYALDNKFVDDQKALGSFINTYPQRITTDIHADLFHTTCFGAYSGLLDQRLQTDDAPTFAEVFGRSAFFLHIPGMAHISGARVLYNTTKSLIEAGISDELLRYGYPYSEPKWIPKIPKS